MEFNKRLRSSKHWRSEWEKEELRRIGERERVWKERGRYLSKNEEHDRSAGEFEEKKKKRERYVTELSSNRQKN